MASNLASKMQSEIGEKEELLWVGQPKQGLLLRPTDWIYVPFSLMWGLPVLFGMIIPAIKNGFSEFTFPYFLAPLIFFMIAVYLLVGRFFIDAWQRARTLYAVTDERILILSGFFAQNIRAVMHKTLSDINLTLNRNGSGTIVLGPRPPFLRDYRGWGIGYERYMAPMLDAVDNAKSVYDLIIQNQRATKA
jgi:hypothetical protein